MTTNILVVDDSQIECLLVEAILRKNPDYHVTLAANGSEALRIISAGDFHVVITDLIMPTMNGLELVRTVRDKYPQIPVILLTAYGDELTATEALEAGAASYVPKARKAERLMPTVERVAERALVNQSQHKLAKCMLEYHCRFSLKNDVRLIRALVNQIEQAMAGMGFADLVERIRIGEALEEALLNAMYHGNLEVSSRELAKARSELDEHVLARLVEERCRDSRIRSRRILCVAHVTQNEARFVVRDEGRGFGAGLSLEECRNDFATGQRRGMTLIRSLMDEVTFNEDGNELVMRKRASSTAAKLARAKDSAPAREDRPGAARQQPTTS